MGKDLLRSSAVLDDQHGDPITPNARGSFHRVPPERAERRGQGNFSRMQGLPRGTRQEDERSSYRPRRRRRRKEGVSEPDEPEHYRRTHSATSPEMTHTNHKTKLALP